MVVLVAVVAPQDDSKPGGASTCILSICNMLVCNEYFRSELPMSDSPINFFTCGHFVNIKHF